jgi:hypothetical protein
MTGPRPCQTRGREGQNTSITLWGVALGHVPGPAPARHRANRRGPRAGPPRASAPPGAARGRGVPPGRACERAGLGSCVGYGAISCTLRMIFVSYPGIVDTGGCECDRPDASVSVSVTHRSVSESPGCIPSACGTSGAAMRVRLKVAG